MSKNTIFGALGYSVVAIQQGIYHLQIPYVNKNGSQVVDVIALLFSEAPLSPENRQLKLFTQEVPIGLTPARIIFHWQMLDARRLEASGFSPIELELSLAQVSGPLLEMAHSRPNGVSIRRVVKLSTGEIVCYN